MIKKVLIPVLCLLISPAILRAQEKSNEQKRLILLDSISSPSYIAWDYMLDELKIYGRVNSKEETLFSFFKTTSYGSSDELIARLSGVNMIRRGNYALEPVIRGLSAGQLIVTLDGMRILGACTDKMDPVTAYVEPQNLESVTITHGTGGMESGSTVGGHMNLRLKDASLGDEQSLSGSAGVRYQSNSASRMFQLGLRHNKLHYGWRINSVYRKSANYHAGGGEEIPYSGYEKVNSSVNGKFLMANKNLLEVDILGDYAWDIGYPAIPMDVSVASALLGGLTYTSFSPYPWAEEVEFKVYGNHVYHVMDDSHRINVVMPMNMPGRTTTFGGYMAGTLQGKAKHQMEAKLDYYQTLAHAEMTMDPDGESPMFMLTWPDIKRNVVGIAVVDNYYLGKESFLTGSIRLDLSRTGLISDLGKRQFSIFPYKVKDWYFKAIPNVNLNGNFLISKKVKANLRLGFGERLPNESEQFGFYLFNSFDGYDYIGFPNIQAEKSWQGETGVTFVTKKTELGFTVFGYVFRKYILGIYKPELSTMTMGAKGVKEYQNISSARLYGTEAIFTFIPDNSFDLVSAIKYSIGNDANNKPLPLIPPLKINLSIRYHHSGFVLILEEEMATKQNRVSSAVDENSTPSYFVSNIRISKKMDNKWNGLKMDAGVDNIFDRYYREHLDWGDVPRPGRNVYLGLIYTF